MATFDRTRAISVTGTQTFATHRACIRYLNTAALPFPKRAYQKFYAGTCLSIVLLFQVACGSNDNAHTTATTVVPPPPRQVLTAVTVPSSNIETSGLPVHATSPFTAEENVGVDLSKPLLTFSLENGKTFRVGEVVPIYFSVRNAKLRSEGGEYRVRYIIDDEDPQLIDRLDPFGLSGWVPGKHTVRLELIGPDGWPYRNGNQNIVTREITVVP